MSSAPIYHMVPRSIVLPIALMAFGSFAASQDDPVTDDPILVEGDPPLRQSDVDLTARLVAFAFDAALADEVVAEVRKTVVACWPEAPQGLPGIEESRAAWQNVSQLTGAQREVARLAMRDQFLKATKPDDEAPLREVYARLLDSSSPVIVQGEPPLRRRSADAVTSLFEWLASEATGQTVELPETERDEIRRNLARQYPRSSPGDRMLLAHMEHMLYWLQQKHEEAGPGGKANFRANLAELFGIPEPLLPAPFAGAVETWEHPEGLFVLEYPADWPVRYGALPEGVTGSGWSLIDATVFGEAPSEALELAGLPTAGALVCTGVMPEDARAGRMSLHEAAFALGAEMLAAFGEGEPLAEATSTDRAVLMTWRHSAEGADFAVWVSAVALAEPEGAAVFTLTRAPVERAAEYESAFSRIIHSLRMGESEAAYFDEQLELPDPNEFAFDLLEAPLREQMDLIEGLTSGIR